MIRRFLVLGVLGLYGLGACADSGDGSTETQQMDGPVALAEIPARFAAAGCELLTRCLGPNFGARSLPPGETCKSRAQEEFEQSDFVLLTAGVEAGRLIYHPERVELCERAVAAQACQGEVEADEICRSVFEGTVAMGAACNSSAECDGDAMCLFDGACPGVCSARKSEDGPCVSDEECAPGLRCSLSRGPGSTCARAALEGEACEGIDGTPCAGLLFCELDDSGLLVGTCRQVSALPLLELGQSCDPNFPPNCAAGLVCSVDGVLGEEITATCKPRQSVAGAACLLAVPTDCPDGEYCPLTFGDAQAGTLVASCRPLPSAGEPCATGPKDGVCGPGLICDTEICVPLSNLGEFCTLAGHCHSGHCVGGACTAAEFCG